MQDKVSHFLGHPVHLPCKQFGQRLFLSLLQLPLVEGDHENIGGVKFRYIKIHAWLVGLGKSQADHPLSVGAIVD